MIPIMGFCFERVLKATCNFTDMNIRFLPFACNQSVSVDNFGLRIFAIELLRKYGCTFDHRHTVGTEHEKGFDFNRKTFVP